MSSRSEAATATLQKTLRIPRETAEAVEQLAEESGRDFSGVANDLLAEGVKMRRTPGIIFADGPSGRRARIAGTGVDVWELIASYVSVDRNMDRLRVAYHWLSGPQLRAALGYYAAYPAEIDQLIVRNDRWTKSELTRQYPSLDADLG